MDEITPAAAPEAPAQAVPAATPSPAEAARSEIARLRSGADDAFVKSFADPTDAGHAAAVARMSQLHSAAYPEEAGTEGPAQGEKPAAKLEPLPFAVTKDTPAPQITEAHTVAHEAIAAIGGIDVELAKGGVTMLERSIAQRGGKDMDALELQSLDATLQGRFGADYDARMDAFEAALKRGGARGGEWLRKAILASGPATAAWAIEQMTAKRE